MYHGYQENQKHIEWRMNRRRLQNIEVIYGKGWEETADTVHALIKAAEAGDELIAQHADWLDEQATRESVRPY